MDMVYNVDVLSPPKEPLVPLQKKKDKSGSMVEREGVEEVLTFTFMHF